MNGGYATSRQRARDEQRYFAVLEAPLGRKAYGEYMRRHNKRPSLHQLKTMRRAVVVKDQRRRTEKALSFGAVYGLTAKAMREAMGTIPLGSTLRADLSSVKLRPVGPVVVYSPISGRMSSTVPNLREPVYGRDGVVLKEVSPQEFAATGRVQRDVYTRVDDRVIFSDDLSGDWDRLQQETYKRLLPPDRTYHYRPWHFDNYDLSHVERKLYSRIVDAQSQREGDLMRPRDYEDGPTKPADTLIPTIIDNRNDSALVAFDDVPDGAFVEHSDGGNVGLKTHAGVAWLNHRSSSGGFSGARAYQTERVFYILNVTVTINR